MLIVASLNSYGQQTKDIAHRGMWKNVDVPQNSLASLQHAIDQKVWGTEFDVHLTKDNILVVTHDQDFYGIDIASSTYEELLRKTHSNGEKIPTAEEYLRKGLKQTGTKLIFELKSNLLGKKRTLESVDIALELVKKLNATEQTEFIAFDWDACLRFRALDPNIKIHYLNGDKNPQEVKAAGLTGIDYHYTVYRENPTWISECQAIGLKTNVWTVNKQKDMLFFIGQKVDYITTDEPELLQKLLDSQNKNNFPPYL